MDEEENDRAKSPSVTSASGLRRQRQTPSVTSGSGLRQTPSWQSASSGPRSSVPDEKKNSPDLAKLDELIQSLSEM